MKLLVLGGSVFVSQRVASTALDRGHQVTCAHRGLTGQIPEGAEQVIWDRAQPAPSALAARTFDAVVDVSRIPSHVERAVAAWPQAHWTFVSTGSVYAQADQPGQDATAATVPAEFGDLDPASSPEAYGAMKVACEHHVRVGTAAAFIVRPGLIVGPGDPTGRFSYWPDHAAAAAHDAGGLLHPGGPEHLVQFVDVADLAQWIVDSAECRRAGTWDAVCPPLSRAEFAQALDQATGAQLGATYRSEAELLAAGVTEWMGPDSIPLWIAGPEHAGFMAREVSASLAAGFAPSPAHTTVARTLAWLAEHPQAPVTGISRQRELALICELGEPS